MAETETKEKEFSVTIIAGGKIHKVSSVTDENSLWKKLGKITADDKTWPDTIEAVADDDKEKTIIITLDENGKVTNLINKMPLKKSLYKERYFTCFKHEEDPETGKMTDKYDFFKVVPNTLGKRTLSFGGSSGRIGAAKHDLDYAKPMKRPVNSVWYWYFIEKLKQDGYEEHSELLNDKNIADIAFAEQKKAAQKEMEKEEADGKIVKLYMELQSFARQTVADQMVVSDSHMANTVDLLSESAPFTKGTVSKCWGYYHSMEDAMAEYDPNADNKTKAQVLVKGIVKFNKFLEKLLLSNPRKIDRYRGQTVADFMLRSKDSYVEEAVKHAGKEDKDKLYGEIADLILKDVQAILTREENLLHAMEALLPQARPDAKKELPQSPFGDIEIVAKGVGEWKKIKKNFPEVDTNFPFEKDLHEIYEVHPHEQEKKFDAFVKDRKIDNIKLLFHGTGNENMFSIVKTKLLLNPNATIHGKMFGNGIYTALSALKSEGYTSSNGSFWAHGTSNRWYLLIYKAAYGHAYDPYKSGGLSYSGKSSEVDLRFYKAGYNCLHAYGGTCGLRNDEIIFYNEDALCLQYILEFGELDNGSLI